MGTRARKLVSFLRGHGRRGTRSAAGGRAPRRRPDRMHGGTHRGSVGPRGAASPHIGAGSEHAFPPPPSRKVERPGPNGGHPPERFVHPHSHHTLLEGQYRVTHPLNGPSASRTVELSTQSAFHQSLTVLVRYRSRMDIEPFRLDQHRKLALRTSGNTTVRLDLGLATGGTAGQGPVTRKGLRLSTTRNVRCGTCRNTAFVDPMGHSAINDKVWILGDPHRSPWTPDPPPPAREEGGAGGFPCQAEGTGFRERLVRDGPPTSLAVTTGITVVFDSSPY